MAKIKNLNKKQLWDLRKEVVLNSLFIRDYENSLGINAEECAAFFDGYVENLWEIARDELDYKGSDVLYVIEQLDNINNLYDWWCEVTAI